MDKLKIFIYGPVPPIGRTVQPPNQTKGRFRAALNRIYSGAGQGYASAQHNPERKKATAVRWWSLVLVFLISSCFFVYAQEEGEVREYNIGIISPGKIFTKTYEIKEEIIGAASMCDCVKVSVIKKTGVSAVEVEFDPSEYHGLVIQEIKLIGKNNHLITLRLRAYVNKAVKPDTSN
ncbi:MAG: hypothetical protein WC546_02695 [Candidatus Omnitrophota bacterium]|jgi:hypothetical protein